MSDYMMGPLFLPPIQRGHESGKRAAMFCPGGGGGANITAPAVADPTTGMLYVSSRSACSPVQLVPGEEADLQYELPTGSTFAQFANGPGADRHGTLRKSRTSNRPIAALPLSI